MTGVIELRDVTLGYERHPAVHHVSGAFAAGSLTAIVGPNGAGKSTLMKGLAGLLRPLDGEIVRHGLARHDIAYLPQQTEIDNDFPISVLDVVVLGAWRRIGAFGRVTRAVRETAQAALTDVGLEGFGDRLIGALSVGQRQKALFARAMLADAPLLLLDEPFTAMDARTIDELMALVLRWHREGRTIVAVVHDFEQVRTCFPETLLLARDVVAWGSTASVLTSANLLKAAAVSDVWDRHAPVCERIDA
ncbi:MAG TPA: metal ABC transporter ATP-binding protein [Alphaproteobacteria bacterium]|jgi:zinc/manganese transport system ATP-binding protein|nr:metal ABC transporter ATP-binding protein [Alphaproteobacteria bacterium]